MLSAEQEKAIDELADTVAGRAVPLGLVEIKLIAKDLLNSMCGVSRCEGNMSGDVWCVSFMKMNKMSARYAFNIKSSRSNVDAEDIT